MKIREMRQLCCENDLVRDDLLIQFIMKITLKREYSYQEWDYDITEDKLKEWIENFKSGNPIKEMNETEKKKFISIIIHNLNE